MKKLILSILLFTVINCSGQDSIRTVTIGDYYSNTGNYPSFVTSYRGISFYSNEKDIRVVTTYDTAVLYNGLISFKHTHNFVSKSNNKNSNYSCLVYHGLTGCPDTWDDFNLICTECLRHLNVKEKRYTEVVKSEYDIALEKLHKLLKTNK